MEKILYTTLSETELSDLLTSIIQPLIATEVKKIITSCDNSPPNSVSTYLTRKEACSLIRVSLPTISKLTKEGIIRAKIVGGLYRYNKEHLESYMRSRM